MVRVKQLEAKQREDALHRERSPVDKVSVEQVRIGLRWQSVNLENVEQIVKLAVNVTTNGELAIRRHSNVHKRGLLLEQGLHVAQNPVRKVFVKLLFILIPLHQMFHKVQRHLAVLQLRSLVVSLNRRRLQVPAHLHQTLLDLVHGNRPLEGHLRDDLLALAVLHLRILIVRTPLRHKLQVLQSQLKLPQRHVGTRPPVVTLQVRRIALDRLDSIVQRVSKRLLPQVRKAPVRVVDRTVPVHAERIRVQPDRILVILICGTVQEDSKFYQNRKKL